MAGGGDGYIGGDHCVVADINMGVVHHGNGKVAVHMVAQMHMGAAEVRIKRGLNIAVLAQLGKHLFHQRLAFVCFCGSCVVEFIQTVQAQLLPVHNFIIAGQVQRTGVHSVFHCHRGHLRIFLHYKQRSGSLSTATCSSLVAVL